MTRQLWPLDPATYLRHPLHQHDRIWPASNCYVDLWIELLHTAGVEPAAALPFVFAIDAEGDQWTFFKFPAADLYALYGVDIFELNIWRSLTGHIEAQLALGRPSLVEVDAFYLPDTAGTSYRADHVKTTIGVQALDRETRRLGYFHNAGYYELAGDDFAGIFRLGEPRAAADNLPPYVEVAKLDARAPLSGSALINKSLELLSAHLSKRPRDNPFRRYLPRFSADMAELAGKPLAEFHAYAFATFRQCGAAFEYGGAYLRWLEANGEYGLDQHATACDDIAITAQTLQFKVARWVSSGRSFDPAPLLETMASAWDETMAGLAERYGAMAQQG